MRIKINGFDHIVLTVKDIEKSSDFYSKILGMKVVKIENDQRT